MTRKVAPASTASLAESIERTVPAPIARAGARSATDSIARSAPTTGSLSVISNARTPPATRASATCGAVSAVSRRAMATTPPVTRPAGSGGRGDGSVTRRSWILPVPSGRSVARGEPRYAGTVKTTEDLRTAANQSYVGSYRTLAAHCPASEILEAEGVFAFTTGLPLALFNGSSSSRRRRRGSSSRRSIGSTTTTSRTESGSTRTAAPGLGEVPDRRGFVRDERPYPGMVLHPVPDPPAPSAGVEVEQIGPADLDEYLAVTIEAGMRTDAARLLFSASFAADPDVELFIGSTGRTGGRDRGGDPERRRQRDLRGGDAPGRPASRCRAAP